MRASPSCRGGDDQQALAGRRPAHRIARVHDQVQDHLLQLHAVPGDQRHRLAQPGADDDAAMLQVGAHQLEHLADDVVDRQRLRSVPPFLTRLRTRSITSPRAQIVLRDVLKNLAQLGRRGTVGFQQMLRGARVREDRGEWLLHLVRQGGRQLAHDRDPSQVRELEPLFRGEPPARASLSRSAACARRRTRRSTSSPAIRADCSRSTPTVRRMVVR